MGAEWLTTPAPGWQPWPTPEDPGLSFLICKVWRVLESLERGYEGSMRYGCHPR